MFTRISKLGVATAVTLSIVGASAAYAQTKPFAARVASAKASLKRSSDEAFLKTWQESGDQAEKAGINPTQARTWHLWGAVGASLGICRNHAAPTDRADWITKLDQLDTGGGEYFAEAKQTARRIGIETYDESTPDKLTDLELTPAEQKQYCSVELEAVRQILREMR